MMRRDDRLRGRRCIELGGFEAGRGDKLCLERSSADRLHQIAVEAGFLQRRQLVAFGRCDQHDPPAGDRAGKPSCFLGADGEIDQHGVPVPPCEQVGEMRREMHGACTPAGQASLDQRGLDAGRRNDQHGEA
jgi:hypothetical protein